VVAGDVTKGASVEERRGWVSWSEEEKALLAKVWARPEGLKQSVHLFSGHTIDGIKHMAHKMGLPPRSSGPANRGGANETLILKLLEDGPMDITEVAAKLGIWERPARFRLNALHAAGKIHIARYERFSDRGVASRIWALGSGKDAPRPKPVDRNKRERMRMSRLRREDPAAYAQLLARKRAMEAIRTGRLVKRDPAATALFGDARLPKAPRQARAQMEAA
jgi:hypothetical protein